MDKNIVFDLAGNKIKCEKEVKLLGVTIDFELKFNSHISNICKKASRLLKGFAYIWLHENPSINVKLSFSKFSTTLSILSCIHTIIWFI
jgi:hypothetical protein